MTKNVHGPAATEPEKHKVRSGIPMLNQS